VVINHTSYYVILFFEDQAASPVPMTYPCVQLWNSPVKAALALVAYDAIGHTALPVSQTIKRRQAPKYSPAPAR
jgi:hypothetical protein